MNRSGSDEPRETRDARSESLKEDGIGIATIKDPTEIWRRGKRNGYGSVMCEGDRFDALIVALGNSGASTLMGDVSPGNEGEGTSERSAML